MIKIDYKKTDKEFYHAKNYPMEVYIPNMKFIAVHGKGNPNDKHGEFQNAVKALYEVTYAIKMSYKKNYEINGYFDYVAPPLEGYWWVKDTEAFTYENKDMAMWKVCLRVPKYVHEDVFQWACEQVSKKKNYADVSVVFLTSWEEGHCVQMLHHGSYDKEPATLEIIHTYMKEHGLADDIGAISTTQIRNHHEIYLGNPQRTHPDKLKTILRIPVRKESL